MVKSKSSNHHRAISFGLIALTAIIGAGLLVAVYSPEIKAWQMSQSDRIIGLAFSSDKTKRAELLEQARMIYPGDPLASEYLANYHIRAGEYRKAIETYESASYSNPLYLGGLALKVGDYGLAEGYFSKANSKDESAESLAGLALTYFAQGNPEKGCTTIERANKLNLSSGKVSDVAVICSVQKGSSGLSERGKAYAYAKVGLYNKAIDALEKSPLKTTGDWLYLYELYKAQGSSATAMNSLQSGLSQDPSNKRLLQAMAGELVAQGKDREAKPYQDKLDDLEFVNFQ